LPPFLILNKTVLLNESFNSKSMNVVFPSLKSLTLAALLLFCFTPAAHTETLFIEAESFDSHGGWSLDTSFIPVMGSPYLLAHGLGKPVADATGKLRQGRQQLPDLGPHQRLGRSLEGTRTPAGSNFWSNGSALNTEFGTEGADWHWQVGGSLTLHKGPLSLALHDLTGFDGRCDAVLLSNDHSFSPSRGRCARNRPQSLAQPRGRLSRRRRI
jgi:hypothetical protein